MLSPVDKKGFFLLSFTMSENLKKSCIFPSNAKNSKISKIKRRHFVVAIGIGPCLLPLHQASSLRKTGGELFQGIYYIIFTINKKAEQ
jgi:hypothetical protein